MKDTCFFTISSSNYFAVTKTFLDSFSNHNRDSRLFFILCDEPSSEFKKYIESKKNFQVIYADDLKINNFKSLKIKYSILELNTAIKPSVFKMLLKKFKKVIYFDPDIYVTNTVSKYSKVLDKHNFLLTPHILTPYNDLKKPSINEISNSGVYNLGFLGVSRGKQQSKFLDWWDMQCQEQCYSFPEKGVFTDQKFCDFIPSFCDDVYIDKCPGSNIAYWNLHERNITYDSKSQKFFSNKKPVTFFHFSGLVLDDSFNFKYLSKHEERFGKKINKGLLEAINMYAIKQRHNYNEMNALKCNLDYSFDVINNFKHDIYSRFYLREIKFRNLNFKKKYMQTFDEKWFFSNGNEILENNFGLPRYLLGIYFSRMDLQSAFDIKTFLGSNRLKDWFLNEFPDHPLANKIRKDLDIKKSFNFQRIRSNLSTSLIKAFPASNPFFNTYIGKKIRELGKIIFGYKITARKNKYAKNLKHFRYEKYSGFKNDSLSTNIYGYFSAFTGVGKSARNFHKSFQSAGIASGVYDVDVDGHDIVELKKGKQNTIYDFYVINSDRLNLFKSSLQKKPEEFFKIGYWAWELERFPLEYLKNLSELNALFVSSNFIRDAIQKSTGLIPSVIPIPIDTNDLVKTDIPKSLSSIKGKKFNVCFAFDLDSYVSRKNPFACIEAVSIASKKNKNFQKQVRLLIKISGQRNKDGVIKDLENTAKSLGIDLVIIDELLSNDQMNYLRNITNVFLSLHRSEGFGLHLAENMGVGNTVIATGYSGNLQFMRDSNSYLVNHGLVEASDYPYGNGVFWADPDIEHASYCLIESFENESKRKMIEKKAHEDIRKELSLEEIGQKFTSELKKLKI